MKNEDFYDLNESISLLSKDLEFILDEPFQTTQLNVVTGANCTGKSSLLSNVYKKRYYTSIKAYDFPGFLDKINHINRYLYETHSILSDPFEVYDWIRPAKYYGGDSQHNITFVLQDLFDGVPAILRNPENNLDQKTQSRLGVLITIVASLGRQVFVETHSDHILNGIRLGVNYGVVEPEKVIFNFLTKKEKDISRILQIPINEYGRLSQWPCGFFDQETTDLSKILHNALKVYDKRKDEAK